VGVRGRPEARRRPAPMMGAVRTEAAGDDCGGARGRRPRRQRGVELGPAAGPRRTGRRKPSATDPDTTASWRSSRFATDGHRRRPTRGSRAFD